MMFAAASASYTPATRPATQLATRATATMEISTKQGMEVLAQQLNPVVGYWGACCQLAQLHLHPPTADVQRAPATRLPSNIAHS